MADKSALLVAEYIDMTGSNMFDSFIFTGFVGNVSSPISITFQKAREVLCDTVACFLTVEGLGRFFRYLESMVFFGRSKTLSAEKFSWAPCDFVFLAICFLGDIDAVQDSLRTTSDMLRSFEDSQRLLFVGLYIAVRQDHRKLILFLLASVVDISDQKWLYILCGAVQTGNVSMLRRFLGHEYSEQRDLTQLRCILVRAAEYTDTTVRVEMCQLLLLFCDRLNTIESRTRMLVAACRSNDVIFADWIVRTGPVKFYDQETRNGPFSQHPLLIATNHDSTDIIRFLLKSKFEVYQDTDQLIIREVICRARILGRFDVFTVLLPYRTLLTRAEILERAAAFDHGLEAVELSWGLADITPAIFSGTDQGCDCSRMMKTAVKYRLLSNVEWLLKHGFRTEKAVAYELNCSQYGHGHGHEPKVKSRRAIFQDLERVQDLLEAHDNTEIEIKCSNHCTLPTDLKEIMCSPRPWEDECACDQTRGTQKAIASPT